MYKYSFVVYHNEYDQFLEQLRALGVLHIIDKGVESTAEIQDAMKHLADVSRTKRQLEGTIQLCPPGQNDLTTDGSALMDEIRSANAHVEAKTQQHSALQRELSRYAPWGGAALDTNAISRLTDNGVEVKLFVSPRSRFNAQWAEGGVVEVVSEQGGNIYFVALGSATYPLPEIDAEEVILPARSFREISADIATLEAELDSLAAQTSKYVEYAPSILARYEVQLDESLQMMLTHNCTASAAEGSIKLLEGYVPEDCVEQVDKWLDDTHTVHLKAAATYEDQPPVKLKNSKFAKLFEPVTEMFALPNYSEIDPTPLFAPFFMLFFGLCFGDAGYGLIVLVAAIFAKRKVGENLRGYCNLAILLGAATIVVSLLTGMVFGIDLSDPSVGVSENIRKYFISDKNFTIAGYSPMMVVAVALGVIQIIFGMCVNVAKISKQRGKKYTISTISWIAIIPLLAITFALPAVGIALPQMAMYVCYALIACAVVGIYFFNSPDSGIAGNIGSGLWTTYNMATGLLGDTLSYIRLFALGLTGGILGNVFNTMAFQAGDGLPWYLKFIVVLLILLVGHAMNFCLCLIGAFVHPMRLTFVEFYKNAGFEGGGKRYKPFKQSILNNK